MAFTPTQENEEAFRSACRMLATHASELDQSSQWPTAQLHLLGEMGLFRWFVSRELGGDGRSEPDLLVAYIELARSCLTTAFILTQRQAAVSRIVATENKPLRNELLPGLLSGELFATVGISHLTTSRRHLARPVMIATPHEHGFILNGMTPWVTGATCADLVVAGATLEDGRQLLVSIDAKTPGVKMEPPAKLVALSASQTGSMTCDNTLVELDRVLMGPVPEVMKQAQGARTGGLQTSALAIGLAKAATTFMLEEAAQRPDLGEPADSLRQDGEMLERDLLLLAQGEHNCSSEEIRRRANSLALRSTQAALAAAKGAGYVSTHPTGRWCREALFFLVWSCPPGVVAANLCELAGIEP